MEIEKIREIIADTLGLALEDVTPDKSFAEDLDADSLDLAEIVIAIEGEFSTTVPDEVLEKIVTVQDAYDLVKNLQL